MKIKSLFKRPEINRNRIVTSVIILLVLLLLILFGFSPLRQKLFIVIDLYLGIIEELVDMVLSALNSKMSISNHDIYLRSDNIDKINNGFLLKKWALFLLLLFWVTPTTILRKIKFSGLLILGNFFGSFITILLTVILLPVYSAYMEPYDPHSGSAFLVGRLPHLLIMIGLLIFWLWFERNNIYKKLNRLRINTKIFEDKIPVIIIVMVLYALLSTIMLGCFHYYAWIDLLFNITAKILSIFNYEAVVEPFFLVGENGSIFMDKRCLGFNTMLVFATLIFITSDKGFARWLYILFGLIVLNVANIIRFVLLFIHIQKFDGYVLKIDLHDLFNYVIYIIVFILWIIWIEKYSDISKKENKQD